MNTESLPVVNITSREARELAKFVRKAILQRFGSQWERFFTKEVQKALVQQEVLLLVLSWPKVAKEDIQRMNEASLVLFDLVP